MILLLRSYGVCEGRGGGGVVNIDIEAVFNPAVYTLSPSYIYLSIIQINLFHCFTFTLTVSTCLSVCLFAFSSVCLPL